MEGREDQSGPGRTGRSTTGSLERGWLRRESSGVSKSGWGRGWWWACGSRSSLARCVCEASNLSEQSGCCRINKAVKLMIETFFCREKERNEWSCCCCPLLFVFIFRWKKIQKKSWMGSDEMEVWNYWKHSTAQPVPSLNGLPSWRTWA